MIKQQRHDLIMKYLEEKETMQVSELVQILNCSAMTVRRDIDELAQQELVIKIHGGAMIQRQELVQPSFDRRIVQNTEQKKRIGAAIAKRIPNGASVFFDAGTTPLYVAKALPGNLAITAITNSLMTAAELCTKPNVTVIMLGGELHHSSLSAINQIALEETSRFVTDLAIISTKAIHASQGLFETTLPLIAIKRAIVERSNRVILAVDSSKFHEHAMCLCVEREKLHAVVTDSGAPREQLQILEDAGIEVVVV